VLALHALARAVAADGHRVLLSGEGADELWFGYRRQCAVRWLPSRGVRSLRRVAPAWSTSYAARLLRAASSREPYAELLSVTSPGFRRAVLAPDLQEATQDTGNGSPLERARTLDRLYLRWDLLPKLDVAAMAAGVEGRCPYLDREVRALAAPPVARSLGKRELRAAFAAELPASVRRGSKRGFGLPLDRWFRQPNPLLDVVLDRRSLQRPHVCADGVRAAVDRHRAGRADLGHGLYLLAAMEIHLRCREEAACASAAS
jgi:asparagine synthase (glutamine-hydrolysing)